MAEQLNLLNRDPNEINNHVQVAFEDVLAEPDGLHSIDCVWKVSHTLFNCCKHCCYNLYAILCGLFIACYWGYAFALISFQHVWLHTPCLRVCTIYALCTQKYFGTCINCCLAPFCEVCAIFFSRITVINKSG